LKQKGWHLKCFSTGKRAKKQKHIVFPEGNDEKFIAASRLLTMDVVDISILGNKQIENKVAELGIAFDFRK
jgi:phosphate acetyltransferase